MESGLQTVFLVDVAGRSLAEPDFRRCVRACQRHGRPARRALLERARDVRVRWVAQSGDARGFQVRGARCLADQALPQALRPSREVILDASPPSLAPNS